MRIYTGIRLAPEEKASSAVLVIVARYDDESGAFLGMQHLTHIQRHSPTGMSWGYNGHGPADLALSILADHFGELPEQHELYERGDWPHPLHSIRLHQDFKRDFVSIWGDHFMIQSRAIQKWVAEAIADGETEPLPI